MEQNSYSLSSKTLQSMTTILKLLESDSSKQLLFIKEINSASFDKDKINKIIENYSNQIKKNCPNKNIVIQAKTVVGKELLTKKNNNEKCEKDILSEDMLLRISAMIVHLEKDKEQQKKFIAKLDSSSSEKQIINDILEEYEEQFLTFEEKLEKATNEALNQNWYDDSGEEDVHPDKKEPEKLSWIERIAKEGYKKLLEVLAPFA